ARVIDEVHLLLERHRRRRAIGRGPCAPIDALGRLPVVEIIGGTEREIETVLAALGPEPKPIFPAEGVHVWLPLARCDRFAVDPAVARPRVAARAAGHDAALVARS